MRPAHKTVVSAYPSHALQKAVRKAAHTKWQSQSEFILDALVVHLRTLNDPEIEQLVCDHEANVEAERQEALASPPRRGPRGKKWREV